MNSIYMVRQMKNGKWRLYHSVPQAITAWRGTNDKVTVVREERCIKSNYGEILNFDSEDAAKTYCKEVLNQNAYEWSA